jgi:ABC-type dipeptide/oligopeptide/nickel transport system permease subunit
MAEERDAPGRGQDTRGTTGEPLALRGGIGMQPTVRGGVSVWSVTWRRLRRNRASLAAAGFLVALLLTAVAAPLLAPHGYQEQFRGAEKKPPFSRVAATGTPGTTATPQMFLLGTDHNARDTLSRLIYGARVSVAVGLVATIIALLVGVSIGLASGYYQGAVDTVLMRMTDTVFAFPSILLAVAITAVFDKPSLWVVFLALGIVGWTGLARIVRSQVLSLTTLDYVAAARALGVSNTRILWRHILPNCLGPILVVATLAVGGNILGEAGLSFLGLGVQEPYPSWGGMLAEARDSYRDAWWLAVFPGLAIVLTVLAFNLLGDGLRDALDPRRGGEA